MGLIEETRLTLRTAASAGRANWYAYAALLGMLMMFGGMLALMWCISFEPTFTVHGWISGAASLLGRLLWSLTLTQALARAREP